jgi:hypothetical protein
MLPRKIFNVFSPKLTKDHKAFKSKELLDLLKKNGFKVKKVKKFGFIAFPLCGMPDFLPILKYLPFPELITDVLVSIDEMLSRLPLINRESWGIDFWAEKVDSRGRGLLL